MLKLLLMPFVTCLGNPFLEDSVDLTLDTIDIMDEEVVMSITNVYNTGLEQYTMFVQERLRDQTKNISDPIKKNKLLFSKKTQSRMDCQVVALKEDCLEDSYGASQTQEGDLCSTISGMRTSCGHHLSPNIEKLEEGRHLTFFNAWRHYTIKSKYNVTADIKPGSSKSNKACNVSLFGPLWRHGTSSLSMNE